MNQMNTELTQNVAVKNMSKNARGLQALIIALTLALGVTAQSKERYVIMYKSQQGFSAMENFMRLESAKNYGYKKSFKNVGGMVLESSDASLIQKLNNHPEIAVVEKEFFTPSPKPLNGFTILNENSNKNSNKNAHKNVATLSQQIQSNEIDLSSFAPGDATPWGILAVKAPQAWALSDGGAKARVLVLDTGIDPQHAALKANFERGRNFFESDTGPNPDDFLDEEGHGTHCSGTIAGSLNAETGFAGVAPNAKLLMGRVCGSLGCSNVAVVEGIDWGIAQKVDVISMSLGGPIGSNAEKLATQRAEKANVVVVAASGNSAGEEGYSHQCTGTPSPWGPPCGVSFPAAFPTVTAVGAINNKLEKTSFSQWGPELDVTAPGAAVVSSVPTGTGRDSVVNLVVGGMKLKVKSAAFSGVKAIAIPQMGQLVHVGLGKPEDFARVNVAGKFALVGRGEIRFSEKVENAIKAKATGVVIYNNTDGLMQGSLSEDGSEIETPVVMIEQVEGNKVIEQLTAGTTVSAEVSTVPSDYASFDGTSMATPHVAGVIALIRSANKSLTPAQVRMILAQTAMPLAPNDTNQFGAGVVQADAAVAAALNFKP